mgnify:CR=1 FL=1
MKIFVDTADMDEIREANAMGVLDGVTTNPTHISKQSGPVDDIIKVICEAVNGLVSAACVAMDGGGEERAVLSRGSERREAGAGGKPVQATEGTSSRQGDLDDQATGNNEVHIQLKLKQTDAKSLQAMEEALCRIEQGTYGVCRDCGEPVAAARLNAIPWTRVCITCKESQSAR